MCCIKVGGQTVLYKGWRPQTVCCITVGGPQTVCCIMV